jgi:hypothetical protein
MGLSKEHPEKGGTSTLGIRFLETIRVQGARREESSFLAEGNRPLNVTGAEHAENFLISSACFVSGV